MILPYKANNHYKLTMDAFIAKLAADAQESLDINYRFNVKDLKKRTIAMEEMKSRYDLTLLPVVSLPEFEVKEVVFESTITGVRYAGENTIEVQFNNAIAVVELSTGEVLSISPFDSSSSYYQGKKVSFNAEQYEETDTEIMIASRRSGYMSFFARDVEGIVVSYDEKDYLLSGEEVFHVDNSSWLGTYCLKVLRHETTKEEIALLVHEGVQRLFRYRGEWYQYGVVSSSNKIWHCRSCVELPCPFPKNSHLHVQGDYIVLHRFIGNTKALQILSPVVK